MLSSVYGMLAEVGGFWQNVSSLVNTLHFSRPRCLTCLESTWMVDEEETAGRLA